MNQRRWALEVYEHDEWRVWSVYMAPENALDRANHIGSKGTTARVVDQVTGEVVQGGPCNLCSQVHAAPYDGSCLL